MPLGLHSALPIVRDDSPIVKRFSVLPPDVENKVAEPLGGKQPLLSLRGVTKRFPLVLANDSIDVDIYRGEIHALLGENGAGRSTLMKILYGFYRADAGSLALSGRPEQLSCCSISSWARCLPRTRWEI